MQEEESSCQGIPFPRDGSTGCMASLRAKASYSGIFTISTTVFRSFTVRISDKEIGDRYGSIPSYKTAENINSFPDIGAKSAIKTDFMLSEITMDTRQL
jgi:hypothetical protein